LRLRPRFAPGAHIIEPPTVGNMVGMGRLCTRRHLNAVGFAEKTLSLDIMVRLIS